MVFFAATKHQHVPTKDILSWIFNNPSYDPDKPVYIDAVNPSRSVSLNQARTLVRRLVAGFHRAGLQPGDCVCIHSFNDIYYPILILGIIAAGGIFAGTNPAYTQYELTHHINTAKAKFIITEPELLEPMLAAAKTCNVVADEKLWIFHPLVEQKMPQGFKSWEDLLGHGEEDWARFDDLETSESTIAARFFSSGTTGLPKAACNSHHNLVAQHELTLEGPNKRSYEIVNLYALPMFHAAVAPRAFTSALKTGSKTHIMRRFDLEKYLQCYEKYGVTDAFMVPPMVVAIMNSPFSKKYSMKSSKTGLVGAAPLGKEPQARFRALLGEGKPFTQVWGMTEATCIATMFSYPEDDDTGSVGRFLPNLDAKLVDENGKDISAYDVEGEICIRGPTVIPGYFENPEANKTSFDADGFYHTGDIGYCSSKNKLWYIVDRKKELIKVRGFQVAPPEIEAALLGHPDIVDAAVIGVQSHEVESELPRAYVVRRPGSDPAKLTEEGVKELVGRRLAKFKRLEGGVRFVNAIPKNASGKILKRILREEAKKEIGRTRAKF